VLLFLVCDALLLRLEGGVMLLCRSVIRSYCVYGMGSNAGRGVDVESNVVVSRVW
jgi:hypothetical protein